MSISIKLVSQSTTKIFEAITMTQYPNIYRIDTNHRNLKTFNDSESIIKNILTISFNKLGYKSKFEIKDLKTIKKDNLTYYLYVYNTDETTSNWKDFLPESLTENTKFTQQSLSLILFIQAEHNLYCIIGGNSYKIIIPFIDHSFGLKVYSKIINPQEDEIDSIKSRGITGNIAGMNEQFRDNFRIIDYIKFGKITKAINLKLCKETSNLHFGFLTKNRIHISVSKSFKIKKSIDFENLHLIIQELEVINELQSSAYLDTYNEITDKKLIDNTLHQKLISNIYMDVENLGKRQTNEHKSFQHDFCDPNNIQQFYEADEYHLKEKTEKKGHHTFKIVQDRNKIYDAVLTRAVELYGLHDRFKFMNYIRGVRVNSYQNKKKTTGSGFLYHISTEFYINKTPIFLIDTKWYELKDSFIKDLKVNTKHILDTYKANPKIIYIPWDKKIIPREGDYNLQYNHISNYIVIDTIIVDGLELCDILHYDTGNLYLIHVKYGFKSEMRELTNQIEISARRLKEAIGSEDKTILKQIYNKLIAKNHNVDDLTQTEFINLFTSKKISYILAYTSHLSKDLPVSENLDKFSSNIARYSLIQCSAEMRANYFDLLNYQIPRDTD